MFRLRPQQARALASSRSLTTRRAWITTTTTRTMSSSLLRISPEIRDALATKTPIVALETTIYTHGALGSSLNTALSALVRAHGAVPAVCGVLSGVPTVGLSEAEVERMVAEGARKVSRRDLAWLVGRKGVHGGTTIAGTMVLARAAGLRVFGTGGLGGVHRGGEGSWDVSADLIELGRTAAPAGGGGGVVAVVCSGCKGFLDIPRTLEVLETQGVPVATFNDGAAEDVDFPAFWARETGIKSPLAIRTEREAAAMIYAQQHLMAGQAGGMLLTNPISAADAIPRAEMDEAIATAVREADEQGFTGPKNTPFVLRRINELTGGRTARANRSLVEGNVARAARVAVELARLEREEGGGM